MSDYDYERREVGRVLETDAETFAIKLETRDGSAHTATRWLNLTRGQVDGLLNLFQGESTPPSVYEAFIVETDALMPLPADMRAVHLLGVLTRAVKRAQMVTDGELPPIVERLERVRDYLA